MLYKPYHLEHGILVSIPTCKSPPERGQLCYHPLLQKPHPLLAAPLLIAPTKWACPIFPQTAFWPACLLDLIINFSPISLSKLSQFKPKKNLSGHTTQIDARGPWDEMGEEQGESCTTTCLRNKPSRQCWSQSQDWDHHQKWWPYQYPPSSHRCTPYWCVRTTSFVLGIGILTKIVGVWFCSTYQSFPHVLLIWTHLL